MGAILHLTSFVQNSPVPVALFDREMHCLAASQSWCQEFQIDPGDVIGKGFFDCLPERSSRIGWQKYLRRCLAGETLISEDSHTDVEHHVLPGRDGTAQWLEWELHPWHTEEQRIGGLVMLTQVFRSRLENKRARRLFEQLRKAGNAAKSSSASKSRFLASMSHEIRTPLNAIVGFSELLQSDPNLTDKQAEYLDVIARSSEHLLALINNVLDYSKIEAGITELNLGEFELMPLLEQIFKMFAVQIGPDVEFHLELVPAVAATVEGDEAKLRQILINLVGNAAKFTPSGRIVMRADVEAGARGDWLRIEVEDTGVGILPADQDRVFEEFTQAGASGQRGQGTGLGLPICRRLAKLMGGSVGLESQVGKGTTVSLDLPVKVTQAADMVTGSATAKSQARDASERLPSTLREQLIEAAGAADVETLVELLPSVAGIDQAFARALGQLVDRFDYDAVTSALRRK